MITELSEIRADNIQKLHKESGLSFKLFGERTGAGAQTISNIINRKTNVSQKVCGKFYESLELPINSLDIDNRKRKKTPKPEYPTSVSSKVNVMFWDDDGMMDIKMEVSRKAAISFIANLINGE